jgi:calcineurin-like phosphoesterase family protein/purple acid phosphatase-like protein/fibronectin type III domain protein
MATTAEGQTVTRGPYLQLGTPTSVVVRWRTSSPTDSRVLYGDAPGNLTSSASNPTVTTEHSVALSGLLASARFHYAVGTSSQILAGGDAAHFFVTSPPADSTGPFRCWVLGDSGTADANARAVRDAYFAFAGSVHTDLWLMLGDNAYPDGTDAQYQAAVFSMYPQMLRTSVLWPTLGNHDGHTADSASQTGPYYDIFTLPRSGEAGGLASGTEAYYSFDFGNVHFVCLESYETDRSTNGAMLRWLDEDLGRTTKQWVIAFWHHPPYSKGSHNSDTEIELVEMRQNALPILEGHGVDLVLSGHSHSYERSFLIDGHYGISATFSESMKVDGGDGREEGNGAYSKAQPGPTPHAGAVYVVAGSSGQASGGLLNHPAMFISLNRLGSMVLDVSGSMLDVAFLDSSGVVADHFTMVKGAGSPPAAPADLAAVAASASEIDLSWTDLSADESEFVVERSLDGSSWSQSGIVGANVTSHADQGLERLTTYHYRVKARNSFGDSPSSNVASATTLGSADAVAVGQTITAGTATGGHMNTWSADGVYESIQEIETKGKDRVNSLEVVWRLDVAGGSSVTLFLKAHQTRSRDGDNFDFSWSADGSGYTNLLTVSRTSDDGTYQSASLPSSTQGTIFIRARDTDRRPGARGKDTLRVDHLFIRSE